MSDAQDLIQQLELAPHPAVLVPAFSFDGFELAPPGWTPDGPAA